MNGFSGRSFLAALLAATVTIYGCVSAPPVAKEDAPPPKVQTPAAAKPAKPATAQRPVITMPPPPPEKGDADVLAEAQARSAALKPVVDAEIAMVKPGPLPEPEVKKTAPPAKEEQAPQPAQRLRKPPPQAEKTDESQLAAEPAEKAAEPAVPVKAAAAPVPAPAPAAPPAASPAAPAGESSKNGVLSSAEPPALTSVDKFTTSNGLPENLVTAVYVDETDAWVGTNGGGVARYNFAENNWIVTKKDDGLVSDFVTDITKYKGRIFVGTNEGISVWDGISWQNKSIEEPVNLSNSIFALSETSLWLAARNMRGGILEFDGEKWINRSNIRAGVILNNVSAIAFDKKSIWLGTTTRGVYAKRGRDWEFFSVAEGIASNFVYAIAVKEDKAFLGGCCGLSYYDGSRWAIFDVPDGLSHSTVNDVVFDGGIVWLGTKNGLSAYNGEGFTNYYVEDGVLVDNRVTSIFVRGDELWVGTAGGLSRLRKGE